MRPGSGAYQRASPGCGRARTPGAGRSAEQGLQALSSARRVGWIPPRRGGVFSTLPAMTQRPQSIEAAPAAAGRPRPEEADCPEQFFAVMRRLRQWADLSYRELEKRANAAGHVLPRATLSGALARRDLPREELLTAFVHACGLSGQDAAAWLEARRRLAVATEPLPVRAGGRRGRPYRSPIPRRRRPCPGRRRRTRRVIPSLRRRPTARRPKPPVLRRPSRRRIHT